MPGEKTRTITRLFPVGKRRPQFTVWLDGHAWKTLDGETVLRAKLRVKQSMSPGDLECIMELDETLRARQAAGGYASRSPHSRRELEDYLEKRGFSSLARERAIEMLNKTGMIDDNKMASRIIRARRRSKYGPRRIQAELLARGIPSNLVRANLEESGKDINPIFECLELIRRRAMRLRTADPATLERKLTGFLLRRGYEYQTVNEAITLLHKEKKDKCRE